MIRQPDINPAGVVIDPPHVTTPSTEPEGQWRGLRVIQSGVSELFRSLNPFNAPPNFQPPLPNVAGSSAGIHFQGPGGQTSTINCLQLTTLAGRVIAAYANLPPEITNPLGSLANLAVAGRIASDQFNPFTARAGLLPEPGTHRENTPDDTPENTKDKTRKASQNPRQHPDKSATATLRANHLPNTSLALGALVGLSAVGASSASNPDTQTWVEVDDAATLGKICHDAKSCSKKYRLIKDIDGSQLPRIGSSFPFTGELIGQNHTIHNISHCLVDKLVKGRLDRLRFRDVNIQSTAPVGVAACKMSGEAMVSNIRVERAYLATLATIATIATKGEAAIGVGRVEGGTVTNTTAVNCTVKTSGDKSYAGIGAGYLLEGTVTNTAAVNCHVETNGTKASAGIGAGHSRGTVTDTTAVICKVKTSGYKSYAGIGAGSHTSKGSVADTTAVNCHVETAGDSANAGIGAGYLHDAPVNDTTALKCTVKTTGKSASAGIGAGYSQGTVTDTTAVNCTVSTSKDDANAGIGAGFQGIGTVTDTTAVNCNVSTSKNKAHAAIGVGTTYQGKIYDTTAVNCRVNTSGMWARAGIGAGYNIIGNIANTRVINSTVNSKDYADITGGVNPDICNASINGVQQNNSKVCREGLDTDFCKKITPLVTPDCQAVTNGIDTLFSANALLPLPITETVASVPEDTTMNISSPGSATMTTPPTTDASVPGMTFSSPGSTTFTTATPPASSLTAVIIALGAVFFVAVGIAVVCACRYYQRSRTKNGRNQPMPEPYYSEILTDRPLPAAIEHHYDEVLPATQENTTKDSNPMVDTGKPEQRPDCPVYQNPPQ